MQPPRTLKRRPTFIREWRKYRELTLEQLAERVDMTSSHLSMLERGQRGYTQETMEALAYALMCEPQDLLMRRPGNDAMWSIWEQAKPSERETIIELARTIVRRRAS
jgi:transcriptional regulator with XRE-family HTH domain